MSAAPQDTGSTIRTRASVGLTARVVQRSELRFSRIAIDRPALVLLRHGTKILESARGQWTIRSGEAIVVAGGQTLDVTNRLSDRGLYEARWLVWDPAVVARFAQTMAGGAPLTGAAVLGKPDAQFTAAIDRALEAIWDVQSIPDDVAAHRVTESLLWLSRRGIHIPAADEQQLTLAMRLRRLVEPSLAEPWTSATAAKQLGLSEATLRRRLAAEGTTFGDLLTDARMSFAMLLLQSTDYAVNRIALEVGYESASRFAIRFRERFGFPPTAIRGHDRPVPAVMGA